MATTTALSFCLTGLFPELLQVVLVPEKRTFGDNWSLQVPDALQSAMSKHWRKFKPLTLRPCSIWQIQIQIRWICPFSAWIRIRIRKSSKPVLMWIR